MSRRSSYSAYDKSHKTIRNIRKILGESINEMQYYQTRLAEIDAKRNQITQMLDNDNLSISQKKKLNNDLNTVDSNYSSIVKKWNKTANRGGKNRKRKTAKKQKRSS